MADYDALLVVSFGGPEGPDDVMPFLRNVTAGRGVPDSRLEQVAEHYYRFGGVSPINQQCRDLILAVQKDFEAAGIDLPVYWGNRNWHPYLADTLAEMAAGGVRRALAFVTSAYSSYSSCRQYLEDIERARAAVGPGAPVVDKIWPYYRHPAFAECFTAATAAALESLPAAVRGDGGPGVHRAQHPGGHGRAQRARRRRLPGPAGRGGRAGRGPAGPALAAGLLQPQRPAVAALAGPRRQRLPGRAGAAGSRAVVVVPIGFVSDHMEVRFDLDIEAAQTAERLGLPFARAATPGTSPRFVAMITDLVRQWQAGPPGPGLDAPPGRGAFCTPGCCVPAPARPAARPRAAG